MECDEFRLKVRKLVEEKFYDIIRSEKKCTKLL